MASLEELKAAALSPRFSAKVDKTETCWLWTGSLRQGYGCMNVGGKKGRAETAHRLAYLAEYGPIPDDKVVMHTCHNKACVRPSHLRLGTRSENSLDADIKRTGTASAFVCGHPRTTENSWGGDCRTCGRKLNKRKRRGA